MIISKTNNNNSTILYINFNFITSIKSASELRMHDLLSRFLINHKVIWLSHDLSLEKPFFNNHHNMTCISARQKSINSNSFVLKIYKLIYLIIGNKNYRHKLIVDNIINALTEINLDNVPTTIFLSYLAHNKLLIFLRNRFPNSKIILDTNDVQFERYSKLYKESSLLKYYLKRFSLFRFKLDEISALRLADVVIAISKNDSSFFTKIGCKKVIIIHQGFSEIKRQIDSKFNKKILFVGEMSALPNILAAKYFIHSIFPTVIDYVPDAIYYIAGANPTNDVKELADKNIIVTGYVNDITKFYLTSRVLVCPFKLSYGQRTRVYEALAHSLPCVVSSAAVAGMGLDSFAGVIIKDDPKEFASEVIQILTDENYYNRLSEAAYNFSINNLTLELTFDKILSEF